MALEFKSLEDLKNIEASSSAGIASQAQEQFQPTGDLWYDIGAGMSKGLKSYQANRKQAYQDFKKRHEGQSFVPGEEDKEWMYKKMLREEGGMSSKDIRNKAMQVFRPEQYEKNMERKKNLSQLGSDISKVPGAIGKGLTNVKNFLTDKKRWTPSQDMKQGWKDWKSGVKEELIDLSSDLKSSEEMGAINAFLQNQKYNNPILNRKFNKEHEAWLDAERDANFRRNNPRPDVPYKAMESEDVTFDYPMEAVEDKPFPVFNDDYQTYDDYRLEQRQIVPDPMVGEYRDGGPVSNSQAILQQFNKVFRRNN